MPGSTSNNSIEGAALEKWVKEARKLAAAAGRGAIADQKIGEVLSASPSEKMTFGQRSQFANLSRQFEATMSKQE